MKETVQNLYFEFVDLWKSLCDIHNQLYQITCEEYLALLNSNIDRVNSLLEEKEHLMKSIDDLEAHRFKLVLKVSETANLPAANFSKFKTVYDFLLIELNLKEENPLLKYHKLMVELIEKTQDQNKKNRIFLNKALLSIQELRNELNGTTKVNNYSRTGEKQAHCR
jgi:flagellar biosynthesis/type III secretory pathway chaperone